MSEYGQDADTSAQRRRVADIDIALLKRDLQALHSEIRADMERSRAQFEEFRTRDFDELRGTVKQMREEMTRWKAAIWVLGALGGLIAWVTSSVKGLTGWIK